MIKKLSVLLLLLAPFLCGFAQAQSFDLTNGRVPIASLDGLWRFHTGDNPAWANPSFDDSQWPLLRSDKDWAQQGYMSYSGMAWYRFRVAVPAGLDDLSLFLPRIRTCYEVYADGKLIGTYGKMPPNTSPYDGGGHFQMFPLPAGQHKQGQIEVALRVWHWPGFVTFFGGGPSYGGARVGDSKEIERLNDLDAARSFQSRASSLILGLLETLAGMGALALFVLRRKEPEYLWFSLMMLFGATNQWIPVIDSTLVWNEDVHDLIGQTALAGFGLSSLAFYQQLLKPRRTWFLKLAVASVALLMLNNLAANLFGTVQGTGFEALLLGLSDLVLNAWVVTTVFTSARKNSVDARLLAGPVALNSAAILWSEWAWTTYILGWQHRFNFSMAVTRKPFTIDLTDATEALFLLAVFAILILRFTRTRTQEERFETEFESARSVQQYLIPTLLPPTPGLSIESDYRPAREVGGDFFQVLPDASDGSALIIVGDVAGKGLQAGMLAALIVGSIRTAATFTTDPGRILALLNQRLQGRGLVTCLALRIERDGSAALANAGHLPPYLNGQELAMEGALPLGAITGIEFPVLRFKLAEGDTLMLMTDGVAEAQDSDGHLFGFERIGEMLSKGTAAAALANAAQAFGQEDDITVLTVARSAAAASA